jgi:hypothetical protein
MADFFESLFGQTPDYSGALAPEQMDALKSNAAKNALIASAVTMLGMSGSQPRQIGTGQAIGSALGAGFGGYQSSFDNTLKQMLAAQQMSDYKNKAEARRRYEQSIAGATSMQPQAMPMAQGQGSQLEMLSRPEFGGGMADTETVGALRGNLPMAQTVDQGKANQAALDYLRTTNPEKFIELTTPKAEATPADLKKYLYAVEKQGYKGTLLDYEKELRSSGAQRLTVDMTGGQKGFENELTLKKTFAAEPVYKAYNEMQSAYSQITDSIKSASPAGDLAAATKFMKLLDPGSVVRESELAMAMAASGALDRLTNLAQMRIAGTKLTDTQRKDFQQLSDQLFSTATATYNSKRSEFEQMGSAYGLNANRALGAPAKLPGKNIKVNY